MLVWSLGNLYERNFSFSLMPFLSVSSPTPPTPAPPRQHQKPLTLLRLISFHHQQSFPALEPSHFCQPSCHFRRTILLLPYLVFSPLLPLPQAHLGIPHFFVGGWELSAGPFPFCWGCIQVPLTVNHFTRAVGEGAGVRMGWGSGYRCSAFLWGKWGHTGQAHPRRTP